MNLYYKKKGVSINTRHLPLFYLVYRVTVLPCYNVF